MKSKLCNVKKPLPVNVATYSPFRVAPFPFWHECTIEYISFQSSLFWPESKITQHVQTLKWYIKFSQVSVILSTRGVYTPLGRPPTPRWPLQRTVRILLECILVTVNLSCCYYIKMFIFQWSTGCCHWETWASRGHYQVGCKLKCRGIIWNSLTDKICSVFNSFHYTIYLSQKQSVHRQYGCWSYSSQTCGFRNSYKKSSGSNMANC